MSPWLPRPMKADSYCPFASRRTGCWVGGAEVRRDVGLGGNFRFREQHATLTIESVHKSHAGVCVFFWRGGGLDHGRDKIAQWRH